MEVYLVPAAAPDSALPDRYELYFEAPPDEPMEPGDESRLSWWRRAMHRFHVMLAAAESARQPDAGESAPAGGKLWRAMLRKIANVVAEQRLLWHLRRADTAQLFIPDDLPVDRALDIVRARLRKDFEKHRRWFVIDGLLALLAVPLTLIPGPNVPALYFGFRVIGHFLSMRGALRGRDVVTWAPVPTKALTELRDALALPLDRRQARQQEIALSLGLEHLPAFLNRLATQ